MGDCVESAVAAIKNEDWKQLGVLMNCQQELMKFLQVSTPLLEQMIQILRQQLGIWGAKISGAGLGDCVIAAGLMETDPLVIEALPKVATIIPLAIDAQGLCYV
jgi:mevalonate kinase